MDRFDARSFLARASGLFVFWVILAGTKPADLAAGLLAALVAAAASLIVLPPTGQHRRPMAVARLAARFLYQSVIAGIDIALRALHPALPLKPGLVTHDPRLPEGRLRAAYCTMLSLLPGTLPLGTDGQGRLVVHVLDTTQPHAEQLKEEERRFAHAVGADGDD